MQTNGHPSRTARVTRRVRNFVEWSAYRLPFTRQALAPRYDYKITPGQLSRLIEAIDDTAEVGGAVVEIGVARGMTSAWLIEHLKVSGSARPVVLIDTFSGFEPEHVEHELTERGKQRHAADYMYFRYGSEEIFRDHIGRFGYPDVTVIGSDAALVDYAAFAPISVALLDVDLYLPTSRILDAITPHMSRPGFIMIDDCEPGTAWDGSYQAYQEYIEKHDLPEGYAGRKGGLIELT